MVLTLRTLTTMVMMGRSWFSFWHLGYGFVEFDDRRDAEDAMKACDGLEIMGSRIAIEWAKGPNRKSGTDECFKCNRTGHWARDCPNVGGRDRGYGRARDVSPYRRSGGVDRR